MASQTFPLSTASPTKSLLYGMLLHLYTYLNDNENTYIIYYKTPTLK